MTTIKESRRAESLQQRKERAKHASHRHWNRHGTDVVEVRANVSDFSDELLGAL
jgi:hypothetical protein